MHGKFVSHDTSKSVSSSNMMQYLDKENEKAKIQNQHLILDGKADEINPYSVENFFNENFDPSDLDDPNSNIDVYTASEKLDKNRGTQKLDSSNFFMLALNPSQKELEHMQKIAIDELNGRGLNYDDIKENPTALQFYNEQIDQIMKLQLKLYTTDVMDNYAGKMDREIYANQEKLPDNAERKAMNPEIEKRINDFFIEKGLLDQVDFVEKMEVEFDKKLDTRLKSGSAFSIKDGEESYTVYIPNDKYEELENNKIAVDKEYFNEKLDEQKGFKNGTLSREKIQIDAKIDKEINGSSYIAVKPNDYSEEIKFWVNNKDITKGENGKIEIEKYKADKMISVAIERDKEQKRIVKIDFNKVTEKEIKAKDEKPRDKILTFNQKVKGLSQPVTFTFKESELTKKGDQYFVEKFKLDYRIGKAKQNGINAEFGNEKERIKHEVWQENGFDTSKRKIERKDLMYFAKVETERTYSHKDKAVIKNKPILTKIKAYEKSKNPLDKFKIEKLEKQLLRDFYTNEIVNEGVKKGGLNYHTHIIVSRHDKTSINPRDKVSMSPNANQKEGNVNNGAKVGFNRDAFYQDAQDIFDQKFNYQRPQQEKYSELKNNKKGIKGDVKDKATHLVKYQIKNEILKHTGMNTVRKELSPVQDIKSQIMPMPIPTSLPKNTLDLVVKVVKMAKNIIVDNGIQY